MIELVLLNRLWMLQKGRPNITSLNLCSSDKSASTVLDEIVTVKTTTIDEVIRAMPLLAIFLRRYRLLQDHMQEQYLH